MNIQTIAQERTVPIQNGIQRRAWLPWVGGILFALLCALSFFTVAAPAQAAVGQSTIPQRERTELLGPIDQIGSANEWVVAGVPVHLTATTRVDERVAPAAVGAWARVEGQGDGIGGLNAARIKILPTHPHIKLKGLLTGLTSAVVEVDGIAVARSTTTQIVGNPQPGVDRVGVRAVVQTGGGLLALRVQKEGPFNAPPVDPGEDEPGAQDGVQLYGILSSRPAGGDVGLWTVSGVAVSVTPQTILVERVGPLVEGAWVQVQGSVNDSGHLVARRIRTISQRRYHRVKGVLQELTETSLRVGGLSLQRNAATKLEGNPVVDKPVEVDAELPGGGVLLAVKIEADDGEHEDEQRHTVEFVGRVESLPDGTLYGEWQVGVRRVQVSAITQIDEHKGLVDVGVLVKVEGTLNGDQSISALEIVVKRGEEDDNKPHDDHEYSRFVGKIETLPANGLLGEWTVDGKRVVVTERTELEGGPTFVVGDTVKVKGYAQNDGSVLAREIEKENEGGHGDDGQEVKFTGAIESLPPSGLLGEWMVDGKQVLVNAQTELKDAAYAVGDRVEVEGHKRADGVVVAKKIEKDD
ncbi:MAG: hypothetical protein HY328_07430 [Chloroflexi bacterium]|nr:hypothetical protein [Chloroflexota bacterium]